MVRFFYAIIKYNYITSNTVIAGRCTCMAIRELCNIRDGIDHLPFATNYKEIFAIYLLYLCFVYRFN